MSIRMIDYDIAEGVLANLYVGDYARYTHPTHGPISSQKIISIETFGVVVQGELNKILIPVSWMDEYRRIDKMRMPIESLPTSPGAARRGRKTNAEKAAEAAAAQASQPMGAVMPGPTLQQAHGSPGAIPGLNLPPAQGHYVEGPNAAQVTGYHPPLAQLPGPAQQPAPAVRQMPIEKAEGNDNWIDDGINSAIDRLRTDFFNILSAAFDRNLEEDEAKSRKAAAAKPVPTCFDCMHINREGGPAISADGKGGGMCAKFNMVPPMFVIVAPEGKCPEFASMISDEDIPF